MEGGGVKWFATARKAVPAAGPRSSASIIAPALRRQEGPFEHTQIASCTSTLPSRIFCVLLLVPPMMAPTRNPFQLRYCIHTAPVPG